MSIKEKKLKIKNLKAFYMDDWELTEEQKDQLDALATDILNVGIEQGKLESSENRQGYKLIPIEPTKEMLIAADGCVIDGKVTSNNIYKAMIGVIG